MIVVNNIFINLFFLFVVRGKLARDSCCDPAEAVHEFPLKSHYTSAVGVGLVAGGGWGCFAVCGVVCTTAMSGPDAHLLTRTISGGDGGGCGDCGGEGSGGEHTLHARAHLTSRVRRLLKTKKSTRVHHRHAPMTLNSIRLPVAHRSSNVHIITTYFVRIHTDLGAP